MPGETQEDPDCVDLTLSDTEELDEEAFEDVDVAEKTGSSTDNLYASLYDAVPDGDATPEAAMLEDIRHATTQAPSIQITWAQSKSKAASRTRTATTTPQDRKNRVLVHQLHVLSILAATRLRNRWCNDEALRDTLQEAVPDILLRQLQAIHPKLVPERRERVRMFEAFMHELVEWWHVRFYVKAGVAASAAWRQPQLDLWQPQPISPPAWIDGWCAETPKGRTQRHRRESKTKKKAMEVAICPTGPTTSVPTYLYLLPPPESTSSAHGLRQAARGRVGSRETKAILFCALCRSLGIPARLVVSVQVCPYSAAKTSARPWAQGSAHEGGSLYIEPLDEKTPPTVWVEVYSKPYQHWLTVDPVRGFVKATGLRNMEPLPAQRQNKMVYVVAFEEDGYARDVTARYTRTLYSRVMRQRPTPRGVDWWANVVKALHRPQKLDRDAVEDVELEDNARREPMPTSVNGFKDHAVFALERHLLRDQVIHPMHRVGTFQGQPVYLRAHVLTLQSARQWYNQGREVKPDEVPLKWAKPRAYTTLNKRLEEQARASGNDVQEGLFAEFQTRRYIPPAVEHGRVPCNAFGNVDLFVPSMLPRGGTHIPHALAARAAKHVGVHYGDAVVGFEFRRFRSLPKLQGIVVPRESADLVRAAIVELEHQEAQTEAAKRQKRAMKNWSKLLTALVVARRVQAEYRTDPPTHPPGRAMREDLPTRAPETRQLRDMPVDGLEAPSSAPVLDHPPPPEKAAPRSGPILSLDALMAAEAAAQPTSTSVHDAEDTTETPAPKRRRIVLVRRRTGPRRSQRHVSRPARSYAEDDADNEDDEEAA